MTHEPTSSDWPEDPSVADGAARFLEFVAPTTEISDDEIAEAMSSGALRFFQIEISPKLEELMNSVGLDMPTDEDGGFLQRWSAEMAVVDVKHLSLLAAISLQNLNYRYQDLADDTDEKAKLDAISYAQLKTAEATADLLESTEDRLCLCDIPESIANVEWLLDDRSAEVKYGREESVASAVASVISVIQYAPAHVVDTHQKRALLTIVLDAYSDHIPIDRAEEIRGLTEADLLLPPQPIGQLEIDETSLRAREVVVRSLSTEIASKYSTSPAWSEFVDHYRRYSELVIGRAPDFIIDLPKRLLAQFAQAVGLSKVEYKALLGKVANSTPPSAE